MELETVKVRYKGPYNIVVMDKCFHGPVKKGDEVTLSKSGYEDDLAGDDWELVDAAPKVDKKSKGGAN